MVEKWEKNKTGLFQTNEGLQTPGAPLEKYREIASIAEFYRISQQKRTQKKKTLKMGNGEKTKTSKTNIQ